MQKNAIITGVTGQDGSYLSELLLEKNYKVYGLRRRSSDNSLGCSKHLENSIEIVEGDILDTSSLNKLCKLVRPDEFYNLAAQSHVGSSFEQPIYTAQCTGIGVLNCLEAIRNSGIYTKFYQASTSELFGGISGISKMTENSPFHPRSPYGIAKLFGYWTTVNYREAYKMFACNGILFNHECLDKHTNLLIKNDSSNMINIVRVKDLLEFNGNENTVNFETKNISIWDGEKWVALKAITVRPVDGNNPDFNGQITNTRHGVVETTRHHKLFSLDGERLRADSFTLGSKLKHGVYPELKDNPMYFLTKEEAELVGLIVGDGWVSEREIPQIHISNMNPSIIKRIKFLWHCITGKGVTLGKIYNSGYNGNSRQTRLLSVKDWPIASDLRYNIYNSERQKKVPEVIFNSSIEIQEAFLNGYNMADGLKSNPCTYLYKNFKTDSGQLAQGLLLLISNVTRQDWNITYENGPHGHYYSINLLSPEGPNKESVVRNLIEKGFSQRYICRETGISRTFIRKVQNNKQVQQSHHLLRDRTEIKKLQEKDLGYVYDICTESGYFMGGVGTIIVGNSPRRGPNFVTRKITLGIRDIKLGKIKKIRLGNLDAMRDWGHAKDMVRGMWMMMNHNNPDDYILSTGITHTVRHFCKTAFEYAGLGDYECYTEIDPNFYRPAEVEVLVGDYSKAKSILGWEPEYKFEDLVKEMIDNDCHGV
ncbi:MAG: GDP-mannose 4,6-dehydratase [Patescibacteria group bacterium]